MWFRLDVGIASHNKVLRLAEKLGWRVREALGAYVQLLCWTSINADSDGVLPRMSFQDLGKALGYSVKLAAKFCASCVEVGIFDVSDKGIILHGWEERNGAKKARSIRLLSNKEMEHQLAENEAESEAQSDTYIQTNVQTHTPTIDEVNNASQAPCSEQVRRLKLFLHEFRFSDVEIILTREQYNTLAKLLPVNEDLIYKLAELIKVKHPKSPYLYATEILSDWDERGVTSLMSFRLNKREEY